MTWIAFNEVRPEPTQQELLGFFDRWGDSHGPFLLAALEARASPQPHYLVQPAIINGEWHRTYASKALSPNGPTLLRQIRARARRRTGSLTTFGQLTCALRTEMAEMANYETRMWGAQHEMMDAVKRSKLPVWALREVSPGSEVVVGEHQRVPVNVFMNDVLVITDYGSIVPNPQNPVAVRQYFGPRYREARFFTHEVLDMWPVEAAVDVPDHESAVSDRTGAPGRPSSSHLVIQHLEYRAANRESCDSLAAEARALQAWLKATYPKMAQMQANTIENVIRERYWQLRPTKPTK